MNRKILKILNNIEEIIGCSILVIMVFVMTLQVFSRYFIGTSFMWSEELSRYCIIWMTFMGAGYGVKNHSHIEMTAVYSLFPAFVKKYVQVFLNFIAIGFYAYIIPDSIKFVLYQQKILSTGMNIPMSYVYVIIPIGVSIMIIRLLIDTVQVIKNKNFVKEIDKVQSINNSNLGKEVEGERC